MPRPKRSQRQPARLRGFDLSGGVVHGESEVEEEVDEPVQEEREEVVQALQNVKVNVEVVANVGVGANVEVVANAEEQAGNEAVDLRGDDGQGDVEGEAEEQIEEEQLRAGAEAVLAQLQAVGAGRPRAADFFTQPVPVVP